MKKRNQQKGDCYVGVFPWEGIEEGRAWRSPNCQGPEGERKKIPGGSSMEKRIRKTEGVKQILGRVAGRGGWGGVWEVQSRRRKDISSESAEKDGGRLKLSRKERFTGSFRRE